MRTMKPSLRRRAAWVFVEVFYGGGSEEFAKEKQAEIDREDRQR